MMVNKMAAESTDLPTCHYSSLVLIGSIFISFVYCFSKAYKIRETCIFVTFSPFHNKFASYPGCVGSLEMALHLQIGWAVIFVTSDPLL